LSATQPPQSPLTAVARDLATYGVMSALSQAGGLLLLPVLTRALSVEGYGSVDIVATFVAFLTMLLQAALPSAVARDYHSRENTEGPARLVSTLLAFVAGCGTLVAGGVAAAAGPLARLIFDDPGAALYLRLGCAVAWLSALLSIAFMTLRMERRIVAFNALRMLQTFGYVGIALALVLGMQRGVRGVFEAQVIAYASVLACALVLIRSRLTWQLSPARLRAALGFSLPMLPGRVAIVLNEQTDRLLLLFFIGLGGVGLLGVAARIASAAQFGLVVFRQAWQPHAMMMIDAPRRDETYRRMLNYYVGAFALGGLWLSAAGPEIFALVAPPEYAAGYAALPWLVGAAILHQSGVLTSLGPLVSRDTGAVTRAAVLGLVVNLGAALLLIPTFGIAGAAIGVFSSNLVYTASLWRASVRGAAVPFDRATALTALVTYVLGSVLLLCAWRFLDGLPSLAARAGIAAAASAVLIPRILDAQARNVLAGLTRRASR
jgi:O-antigen/teichoic acid export membrane protein